MRVDSRYPDLKVWSLPLIRFLSVLFTEKIPIVDSLCSGRSVPSHRLAFGINAWEETQRFKAYRVSWSHVCR